MSKKYKNKIREKIHQLLRREESCRKDRYRYLSVLFCRKNIP